MTSYESRVKIVLKTLAKYFLVAAGFSLRYKFIEYQNIRKLKFAATRRPLLFYIGYEERRLLWMINS